MVTEGFFSGLIYFMCFHFYAFAAGFKSQSLLFNHVLHRFPYKISDDIFLLFYGLIVT